MSKRSITTTLSCLLVVLMAVSAVAQTYNPFNERDDRYRLLGLKRAKQAYETARSEYERQKELHAKQLITDLDLERAYNTFTDAEVNYQQSLLAVLFEEQYITVQEAVKYQAADGAKHVRLRLANASGGSAEAQKLMDVDDELFRSLQPDVIPNVYVSILNEDNAIISQPYEAKIDELCYGQPRSLDFTLLQDLDAVTVFLVYGNGTQRTMKIFLQKDATVNRVAVQSEQFSQEVELGTSSSFDLTLELFSGVSNTFSLEVVNLPEQIGRFFKDPAGQVRLSQLKFTESTNTKRAALEISLPDRPTDEVVMDEAIPFYVLVLPRDQANQIKDLRTRHWTAEEIEALDAGYVRLELMPRGKGELRVRTPQLYHAIEAEDTVNMYVDVFNEGTRRLDNIETKVDLPLGWTKRIEPSTVQSLDISEEARVDLAFIPPESVAPGKYEIRVRTSGMSSNVPVTGEDKTVTVEIQSGTPLVRTLLLVLFLVGLVAGIVVYGVRLSRR